MQQTGQNVEQLWQAFRSALKTSINCHIPHKTARPKDSSPWITKEIKQMIRRRDRLYKRKKKSNDPSHIKKFKEMKQQVQKKLRHAYWSYIENIITPQPTESNTNRNSMKRFWTYIKHKRKDNSAIPGLRDKGLLHTDAKQKADILNRQFQSVFSTNTPISAENYKSQYSNTDKSYPVASDINITCNGIEKLLESLNPHKAPGPDQIRPMVLKQLAPEIAPILTIIYQTSLDHGTVPEEWKTAHVSPIYKKGQKYSAVNYRPISLTCICCKIMEHVITSHIMKHGETNNILYPLQHGFRKARSCETQLLEFTDNISINMEQGKQTDVLVMDFSKAFDKVSHGLLIHKLHQYGIQGKTNAWIQAFLSGRSQSVVVEGTQSDAVNVESGVPQGSVLGPSLFLYYINDIPEGIGATVRLFADDTIAYLAIAKEADCQSLQKDLDRLAQWEEKWKMEFHPDKCTVLSISKKKSIINFNYTLHNNILKHVTSAKYLGCTLNKDLDWGEHINNISNKANRNLNFIRRNLNIASTHIKETAYTSLVRPTVEYACTVWDPHEKGDINRLEMIQRRAARFVKNNYHNRSSVTDMINDLGWRSLQDRRRDARLTMLFKIDTEQVAIDKSNHLIQPNRLSRNMHPRSFQIPSSNTSHRLYSFFPRTIKDWNSLPPEIMSVGTVEAFKSRLATHYI